MENGKYEQKIGDCAFFSPKDKTSLTGEGYIVNAQGSKQNALIQKVTTNSNKVVRRVFLEVGAVFENENENPKAPKFTGKVEVAGLDVANKMSLWFQQPKNGGDKFLSSKIDEPMQQQQQQSADSSM